MTKRQYNYRPMKIIKKSIDEINLDEDKPKPELVNDDAPKQAYKPEISVTGDEIVYRSSFYPAMQELVAQDLPSIAIPKTGKSEVKRERISTTPKKYKAQVQYFGNNPAEEINYSTEDAAHDATRTVSSDKCSGNSNVKVAMDELNLNLNLDEKLDFKSFIEEVQLKITPNRTRIIAVAIDKNDKANNYVELSANRSTPFGGYVYDRERDVYRIACLDYTDLGFVPCSFEVSLPNIGNWKISVPLPVSVVDRYLNIGQKRNLRAFKEKFKKSNIEMQILQMRGT